MDIYYIVYIFIPICSMFTTCLYFIPSLYQQSLGVTISIVYMFLYLILLSYARFIYLDVLGETLLRIF